MSRLHFSGCDGDTTAPLHATVVIPTYNGERYLPEIFGALAAQELDHSFEVLVIDSGSTDQTLEIVRSHPDVRLHEIPHSEFGHGRTRNLAAEMAKGEFVVYLTHDAIPSHARWLYEILKPFELMPRIAAVMGSQIPRPHCFPLLKYDIRALFAGLGPGFGTTLFYNDTFITDPSLANAAAFYSDVNSAARRSIIVEKVPYRDVTYSEDQLFGKDLLAAGYFKAYAPRASVVHSNDLTLREYDDRIFDETQGLREVGIDVAVPPLMFAVKMISRGVAKDFVGILRDREYGKRQKLIYLVTNPLYHVQKWRGLRRGASTPLRARAPRARTIDPATGLNDQVKASAARRSG